MDPAQSGGGGSHRLPVTIQGVTVDQMTRSYIQKCPLQCAKHCILEGLGTLLREGRYLGYCLSEFKNGFDRGILNSRPTMHLTLPRLGVRISLYLPVNPSLSSAGLTGEPIKCYCGRVTSKTNLIYTGYLYNFRTVFSRCPDVPLLHILFGATAEENKINLFLL